MAVSTSLEIRSGNSCELCQNKSQLTEYLVPPKTGRADDEIIVLCSLCNDHLVGASEVDEEHWRCLNDAIWSPIIAVQVVAHRILSQLSDVPWAQDLLGMMYLDEEALEWAHMASLQTNIVHKDSNGHILQDGDTVTLIKDLPVKGANFTAKRGTAVRRTSLVKDNAEHIQVKVNDQTIIILTQYVKK